ncbi:MAG: hypothetical protein ACQES5_06455 [Thermodesulfobacteriota bacterium]
MSKPLIPICLLIFLLSACAPLHEASLPPVQPGSLWTDFVKSSEYTAQTRSFRIKTSINYSGPERQDRLLADIWGDNNYPIRMNLKAGMGQVFSMWREDSRIWEAYYPSEDTVYIHKSGHAGAEAIGFPTPFNLLETSRLLTGQYTFIVPEKYAHCERQDEKIKFFFSQKAKVKSITLDKHGHPVQLTGKEWKARLSDFNSEKGNARRIDLEIKNNQKAVIRIKEIEFRQKTWEAKRLQLKLPPETERLQVISARKETVSSPRD